MDQQLKQRLIGVTVIVALIVIFVPMLFDKTGDHTAGVPEGIPPIPDEVVETKPMELPKSAEDLEEKDKEAIPESGYKIIPLTDEPQPAAKQKGNAAATAEVAPMEDDEAPAGEGAGASEALEEEEPGTPASTVKTEKLDKEPVKEGKKTKPQPTPAALKADASKAKAVPAKPSDSAKAPLKPAKPEPAAKPSAEKSAVAQSWVVQTGSFAVEAKASALVEKLRQSKYPAYMEKVQGGSGTLFRVKVGPELDRGRAEQMQKQIEASTGLKGIIVPHR